MAGKSEVTVKLRLDMDEVRRLFSPAFIDVFIEREEQREKEGFSSDDDDKTARDGQFVLAAIAYADFAWKSEALRAATAGAPKYWPWDKEWWKPTNRRRDLVKAAALLLAEIERIDRQTYIDVIEPVLGDLVAPLRLGRFGHDRDPAADFCAEVQAIDELLFMGTVPAAELRNRVGRAMGFRVGGDLEAIDAKARLREIDQKIQAVDAGASAG